MNALHDLMESNCGSWATPWGDVSPATGETSHPKKPSLVSRQEYPVTTHNAKNTKKTYPPTPLLRTKFSQTYYTPDRPLDLRGCSTAYVPLPGVGQGGGEVLLSSDRNAASANR